MRVKFTRPEHFKAALAFAKSQPPETKKSFKHCLGILNRIKRNSPGMTLELYPDFVEHSFGFSFRSENGRRDLHGGMILHGFQETFAVELSPRNYPAWSIHT